MQALLDGLEVGEGEFDLDHAEVLDRVGRPGDVVVDERPQDEHDGVDLADVGEELVAEALALAGALDEPADVDDLDRGVDGLLRLRHRRELVEPVVGHLGHPDVRVLRGERVRRGERTTTGERVVQRALARVGEADQSETFHEPPEATDVEPRPRPAIGPAPAVLCGIGLEGCNSFRTEFPGRAVGVSSRVVQAASGGRGADVVSVGAHRSRASRIRSAVAFGRVVMAR